MEVLGLYNYWHSPFNFFVFECPRFKTFVKCTGKLQSLELKVKLIPLILQGPLHDVYQICCFPFATAGGKEAKGKRGTEQPRPRNNSEDRKGMQGINTEISRKTSIVFFLQFTVRLKF